MKIEEIIAILEAHKTRSAWDKGVTQYAFELLESLEWYCKEYNEEAPTSRNLLEKILLNGASDWSQYSWGGCSLIYNADIAERLCSPSEYKKTKEGRNRPNAREEWLDTQARALFQAYKRIERIVCEN